MKVHPKRSWLGIGLVAGLAGLSALAPHASADRAKPAEAKPAEAKPAPAELSLDAIVAKHIAALGGADALRATKTMSYVVSVDTGGKKLMKKTSFARPGKMRVDVESEAGKVSKGFDGTVAWIKKADGAAVAMSAEDTAAMKAHADFDEPLLDHAKRGIAVKLIGRSEVAGTPVYEFDLVMPNGDKERLAIDAATFLPLQRTVTMKKDGKATAAVIQFGDFKKVQGRMVNHRFDVQVDGVTSKSVVSQVTFDRPLEPSLFAMPRK